MERLFQKYEQGIERHTRSLLHKLSQWNFDVKEDLVELFAAKLLNFVRNPFCIEKVLNSFPGIANVQPTHAARVGQEVSSLCSIFAFAWRTVAGQLGDLGAICAASVRVSAVDDPTRHSVVDRRSCTESRSSQRPARARTWAVQHSAHCQIPASAVVLWRAHPLGACLVFRRLLASATPYSCVLECN